MTERNFYIIWNPNNLCLIKKHADKEDAKVEAERLATKYPGQEFIVLVSLRSCKTALMEWQEHVPF